MTSVGSKRRFETPNKSQLSQLVDSSVLMLANSVVLSVFKHNQDQVNRNQCLVFLFPPQSISLLKQSPIAKTLEFYLGTIQYFRQHLKYLVIPEHNLHLDEVYLLGSCTFPTISRTITNAISCWNTPFLSPPFWCVSSPPRWSWSWPKQEKTSKSLLFVTYVICTAIFISVELVLSPKANISPFIFLFYTNTGYLFSKTCQLHKNFLPTPHI